MVYNKGMKVLVQVGVFISDVIRLAIDFTRCHVLIILAMGLLNDDMTFGAFYAH